MRRNLTAGLAVAGVLAGLAFGAGPAQASGYGEVKGKVVDVTTGKPVKTACVIIWVQNGVDAPVTVAVDPFTGAYDATNVPSGAWKATAYDCGAKPKYYSAMYGGPSPNPSVPGVDAGNTGQYVNVIDNVPTTGVDIALGKAALFKLTVKNSVTKRPVQNVSICPQDASSGGQLGFCAPTDATGKSTIASVPGVATKLYVLDNRSSGTNPSPPGYPVNIYLPGTDSSGATVYNPVAGGNPVKFMYAGDPTEVGTGTVTGLVTDKATGAPIADACATAWTDSLIVTSDPTAADGVYTISGVPNGNWEITAGPCDTANGGRYNVVYKNQPGLDTAKQTLVQVLNGQTTPKIDFKLGASGQIHVLVVDATNNQPIAGAGATPYRAARNINGWAAQNGYGTGDFTTGVAGDVLLGDVVPGASKFIAFAPGYDSTWYGATADFDAATKVTIVAGANPSITIALQPSGGSLAAPARVRAGASPLLRTATGVARG